MYIALRIPWVQFKHEGRLTRLISFLERNGEGVKEIVFFTEHIHGYLPVSAYRERLPALAKALDAARSLGFRAGINILNTLGQFDESPELLPPMDVPPMVGLDGEAALNTACPRSRLFLEATAERYRLTAELQPDILWIDDDVRQNWHVPVLYGCFCQDCLDAFNARIHTSFSREEIKEALKQDKWPEENTVRQAWLGWNSDIMDTMYAVIERAVHGVSPKTEIGLMHGWQTYSGAGYGRWLNTLRGPDKVPVHFRPGGGFYNEDSTTRMIEKAVTLPPDISDEPVEIATIQCELENFPHSPLDKTPRTTMVENTCYHAAGCTGVLFNIIGDYGPLEEYAPFFEEMRSWMPFWKLATERIGDMPLAGLWEAVSPYGEGKAVSKNSWPVCMHTRDLTWRLVQFGLPMALFAENARGAVLTGANFTTLPLKQVENILKRGAIVDGDALTYLWQAGLGELTGVKVERTWKRGIMERHLDHPWNAGFEDSFRDARPGFFNNKDDSVDYTLAPLDNAVVPLDYLVSQDEREHYGICAATYENRYGGRIVTLGYRPWSFFRKQAKHQQYLHAARWVSHGTLPLWVETFSGVTPFVRQEKPGGEFAALLLNPTIQPRSDIRIGLATEYGRIAIVKPFEDDGEDVQIPEKAEHGWAITISHLGAWEWALVYSKSEV